MKVRKKNDPHIGTVKTSTGSMMPIVTKGNNSEVLFSVIPFIILTITGLLYYNSLYGEFTGFDDDFYIVNNPMLKEFSSKGLKTIFTTFYSGNYHPLTTLSNLIEYQIWGLNPVPFHFFNLLLHLINTWLVYMFIKKMSSKKLTSLFVASFFAIHPLHVESVAWISERKDVLYSLFYFLSLLFYLKYLDKNNYKNYFICLLFFVCSLLSKSAAVTLPILMLAFDFYKRRKPTLKLFAEKLPFIVLSISFGIAAIISQRQGGAYNGLMISYGFINSIFLCSYAILFYLSHLLIPYSLSAMHYFPPVYGGKLPWEYYTSLPILLIIILLAWLLTKKKKYRRELLFAFIFFVIVISVMLQIVSVGSALTAERYSYVAYIGFFYFLGLLFEDSLSTGWRAYMIGLYFGVFSIFSYITFNRVNVWKNDEYLFNDIIEKNPGFYYGYWLRGNMEKKTGNFKEALTDYSQSIRINPDFADAYFNRGIVLTVLGDMKSAIPDFTKSIQLSPNQADAYNNRGWAYFTLNDSLDAMRDFNKAIELKAEYSEAYNNRGYAHFTYGNTDSALTDYSKAILFNSGFIKPYYNRASVFAKKGDFKKASDDYETIIHLNPNDGAAFFYNGIMHLYLKDTNAACSHWKKSLALGNKNAEKMLGLYCDN